MHLSDGSHCSLQTWRECWIIIDITKIQSILLSLGFPVTHGRQFEYTLNCVLEFPLVLLGSNSSTKRLSTCYWKGVWVCLLKTIKKELPKKQNVNQNYKVSHCVFKIPTINLYKNRWKSIKKKIIFLKRTSKVGTILRFLIFEKTIIVYVF